MSSLVRSPWCLWVVTLLAACSGSGGVVDTPDTGALDAAGDRPPDVTMDRPEDRGPPLDTQTATDATLDAPPEAQSPDTPEVPSRCGSSADCRGNPAGEACDVTSGRCVGCVPSMDTCPASQHCDGATLRCVPGCRADEGCPEGDAGVPSDGSALGRRARCDAVSHACVECVTDEHCPPGTLCVGQVCTVGCNATRPCPAGQTCCAGACIDPLSNVAHCGLCDARCAVPNATPACMNGACAVGLCMTPFGDCDRVATNGCETDTRTSTAHCGACGMACATRPQTTAGCAGGTGTYTCTPGFADCDGVATNGCETDTRASAAHCGGCGRACMPPNATGVCVDGACTARCDAGFGDCDRNASNGCETDTRASAAHCGACGAACPARPNTLPACAAGRCASLCVAGFADCDGDEVNGCEVDTRASAAHCGGCGRACAAPHAAGACAASRCALDACDAGYADCNRTFDDGCEVHTASDPAHCGLCGARCVTPGAAPACRMGACAVGACMGALGDCDGAVANGCETDTRASNAHCGRCGNACGAGRLCVAGACIAEPGCADGTREGFTDTARFPRIAACRGVFEGFIDEASARAVCASGWHVCRGGDVRAVTHADARGFDGCFAYDAAQDCNYCSATCRGIVGDPRASCGVADAVRDADMAGMGRACSDYGGTTATCLADGRIDSSTNTFGCRYDARLAGVVCCRDGP
ncbi:MAG: hypothetical protein HY909_31515 [Deltaproteobacteria bacterium]|nr:hypothetical protein [Deltaproteobacteria bacterium]